jgi:hypothetical protein
LGLQGSFKISNRKIYEVISGNQVIGKEGREGGKEEGKEKRRKKGRKEGRENLLWKN